MGDEQVTYDYSEAIQKKIIAMFLSSGEELIKNAEVIKPEFFSNPALGHLSRLMVDFYKKYKRGPTLDEIEEELNAFLDKNPKLSRDEFLNVFADVLEVLTEGDFEYVRDKAVDFARYQAMQAAILKSAETLRRKKDYGAIVQEVRLASMIGERSENLGVMYYETTDERVAARSSGHNRRDLAIGTGIAGLDRLLGGGIGPAELGIIMGPSKRGKSITAINFSLGALVWGHNCLHVVLESSEDRTQVMYDAAISDVPKEELKSRGEEVSRSVKSFFENKANGRLLVKYFPANSCSPWDIEILLQKQKLVNNFVPKLIIIDYLGLLKPADKSAVGRDEGKYGALGQITKELLSLAQRGIYSIWLLHQSTRGSFKKDKVDLDDSGDSIEPMRDADLILTLGQKEENRKMQEESKSSISDITIFAAGGREIASRWTVNLVIDTSRCKIWEKEMQIK